MPTNTLSRKERLLVKQARKCCLIEWGMCLMPEAFLTLTIDGDTFATWEHLTPKVRGGTDVVANLRLSHKKCNHARADRPLPGYTEVRKEKPPAPKPMPLAEGEPEPMPFSLRWLEVNGYMK